MARWSKGKSGNSHGRPKKGTAIAELARQQIEKHQSVETLGQIAAGQGEMDTDQQLRAIQLLLAYGYGPPRPEIARNDGGVVIQVLYADRNPIAIRHRRTRRNCG